MAGVLVQQQEEMIVDETTGLVQKVETVTFAAHDEYGNVIVRQQKRAVAARLLPPQIQRAPPRALVSSTRDRPPRRYTRVEDWKGMKLLKLCLLPFFIPCVCSRKSLIGLQLLIFTCVVIGTVFIGIGPLRSCTGSWYYLYASLLLLVIFGTILCLLVSCCCFACYTDEGDVMSIKPPRSQGRDCQICWMFIAWFFGMVFLLLVIVETGLVFSDKDKVLGKSYTLYNETGQYFYQTVPCRFEQSLLAGLCLSYVLIMGFTSCWCLVFKEMFKSC